MAATFRHPAVSLFVAEVRRRALQGVMMFRSVCVALVGGVLVALAVASSTGASNESRKVLDATLAGIPASLAGQTFMGATGGGLPWRLDAGKAKLRSDGRLEVVIKGLVLAAGANEGRNPVPTEQALVSCGGSVVATSSPVPYSPDGDAKVKTRVKLLRPALPRSSSSRASRQPGPAGSR